MNIFDCLKIVSWSATQGSTMISLQTRKSISSAATKGPSTLLKRSLALTILVCIGLFPCAYATLYLTLGSFMLPTQLGFTLFVGYLCAFIGGSIVGYAGVAPLVGMLFAGVLLRNVGAVPGVSPSIVASEIRTLAVAIILARAGMCLSFKSLQASKIAILAMGFIPSIAGALLGTLFAYTILGFPILWALTFGFGLASTSPAIIAPLTLSMSEKGYGNTNGLSSILLGALPLDIMVGVVGQSVCLGTLTSTGDKTLVYAHAPIEICSGIIGGLILACVVRLVSNIKTNNGTEKGMLFSVLLSISFMIALGTKMLGYTGAGAMANMFLWTSVANFFDEADSALFQIWMKTLWISAEPLLFSVIGMSLSFTIVNSHTIGLIVALIFAVESCRLFATFGTMKFIAKRELNECVYVAGKWSAKATIQAALATAALDAVKAAGSHPDDIVKANTTLVTYLLYIIIMAPLAAVWVRFSMTKLLTSDLEYESLPHSESRKNSMSTLHEQNTSPDDFISA
ncbi:Sodium/hydrogen exchanger family-domain-containing protein [Chytriomyces sp. MP71]|nr:Sodium/hydrogen exchanger family-domain-containing protein [Chytriomyces sp. MP71]